MLVDVHGALVEYRQRLEARPTRSVQVDQTLAASLISGLNGEPDELFIDQAGVVALSLEWDIDPADVCERIERASLELGLGEEKEGAS